MPQRRPEPQDYRLPVVLAGCHVRVEPLGRQHVSELHEAAG